MICQRALLLIASFLLVSAQPAPEAVVVNPASAAWTRDKDSESVLLHQDHTRGGMDLLVRFPAGHVIPAHFHDSDERIVVVEGRLRLARSGQADAVIETGGFAFLPAREVQRLSCGTAGRCTFYLMWDGPPQSHPAR